MSELHAVQAADIIGATVEECARTARSWLVEEPRRSSTEARRMLRRGTPVTSPTSTSG
jgi:hypothetical protein